MSERALLIVLKAVVRCQVLSAGMTAENMQRQHKGEAMAYVENDFAQQVQEMEQTWDNFRD